MTIARLRKLLGIAQLLAKEVNWDMQLKADGSWLVFDDDFNVVIFGTGEELLFDMLVARIEDEVKKSL
ncbi:MAG: hypothetical protein ACRDGA_07890 [Bacteroidota bacterium]